MLRTIYIDRSDLKKFHRLYRTNAMLLRLRRGVRYLSPPSRVELGLKPVAVPVNLFKAARAAGGEGRD